MQRSCQDTKYGALTGLQKHLVSVRKHNDDRSAFAGDTAKVRVEAWQVGRYEGRAGGIATGYVCGIQRRPNCAIHR